MRQRRRPAPKPPCDRTLAIAAVGGDSPVDLGQDDALLDSHPATKFTRSSRVHPQLMASGQHGSQALLPLEWLRTQLHTENWTCRGPSVTAVARTPAADHPVVPHEILVARLAPVAAADQEVIEVEGAGHGPFGHDLGPQFEDRIHDLLERPGAETGHRRR